MRITYFALVCYCFGLISGGGTEGQYASVMVDSRV